MVLAVFNTFHPYKSLWLIIERFLINKFLLDHWLTIVSLRKLKWKFEWKEKTIYRLVLSAVSPFEPW